jgi:hypothetical protein
VAGIFVVPITEGTCVVIGIVVVAIGCVVASETFFERIIKIKIRKEKIKVKKKIPIRINNIHKIRIQRSNILQRKRK